MRNRDIKVGVAVVMGNGEVLNVINKFINDEGENVVQVQYADRSFFNTKPRDIKCIADENVAVSSNTKTVETPKVVEIVRYLRPMVRTNGRVSTVGNEGVTAIISIDHEAKKINFQWSVCNGETFNKKRGVEEAKKKTPLTFDYRSDRSLNSHVKYMMTRTYRANVAELAPLSRAIKRVVETTRA